MKCSISPTLYNLYHLRHFCPVFLSWLIYHPLYPVPSPTCLWEQGLWHVTTILSTYNSVQYNEYLLDGWTNLSLNLFLVATCTLMTLYLYVYYAISMEYFSSASAPSLLKDQAQMPSPFSIFPQIILLYLV